MATAVQEELQEFRFDRTTVEPGDRYQIDYEDGEIIIVITDVNRRGIWGLATASDGTWYGHWGRIIFYRPIKIGEMTDASFNQTSRVSRLEIVPKWLSRDRHGHIEHLLQRAF